MKRLISCVCILALVLALPLPTFALDVPNPARLLVGGVLDDIQAHLFSIQNQLANTMNIEEANSYEILHNSLTQLQSQFVEDRDKTLSEISSERAAALTGFRDLIDQTSAQVGANRAALVASANNLLYQFKPFKANFPFMLTGITNQILARNAAGNYTVILTGNGFGIDQGDIKFITNITLDGVALDPKYIDRAVDQVTLSIPASVVNPKFSLRTVTRLPVRIDDEIQRPCQPDILGIFGRCKDNYSTSFNISLLPQLAASAQLVSSKPGFRAGEQTVVAGPTIPASPELHNKPTQLWTTPTYVIPAGFLYVSAHLTGPCEGGGNDGGGCQFTFNPQCHPSADKSSVYCDFSVGSHSHQNHWEIILAEKVPQPNVFPPRSYDFPTDQMTLVDYDPTAADARLLGTTDAGNPFDISLKPYVAYDPYDTVRCSAAYNALEGGKPVVQHTCITKIK